MVHLVKIIAISKYGAFINHHSFNVKVTQLYSQGIAYALVANLPPEYGLYSAFMGCFMYCVFGSVKDITIGPTAIMAIMTGDVFKDGDKAIYGRYYAVLLAFTTGVLVLLFGLFQLGFLIDFISVPVIAGFTSAAAITIASGQIKGLLGRAVNEGSRGFTVS